MGSPISKARRNLIEVEEQNKSQRFHERRKVDDLEESHHVQSASIVHSENNLILRSSSEVHDEDSINEEKHSNKSISLNENKMMNKRRKPIVEISSSSSSSSSPSSPSLSGVGIKLFQSLSTYDQTRATNSGNNNEEGHSSSQNNFSSYDNLDESEEEVYNWLSNDSRDMYSKYSNHHNTSKQFHQSVKTPKEKKTTQNITFTPPGWDSPLNVTSSFNYKTSHDQTSTQKSIAVKDTHRVKQKNVQLPSDKPLVTKGNWLTNRLVVNDYIILHSLGQGSYGEVRLCKEKNSNELFAVKVINRKKNSKHSSTYNDLKTEVAIMKKLKHENCVSLHEVMDDPKIQKLYLVMEYMKGGDLMNVMNGKALYEIDIWDITRQIIRGIRYLHDNNIIHGDLKPQNLLVSSNGTIKIGDFGLSKVIEEDQMQKEFVGTPAFVAPEVCSGAPSFDGKKADMYSMGATIYFITFCKTPFEARNLTELYTKIQTNDVTFPFEVSAGLEHIIRGLMNKPPQRRLSMDNLILAPWLQTRPGDPVSSGEASQLVVINEKVEISASDVFNSIKDLGK